MLVADSGYAALDFLGSLANRRQAITCITRLRLDAQLYAPARHPDADQKERSVPSVLQVPTVPCQW